MTRAAIFSEDRTRRYLLIRIWDSSKPQLMFIGLNPSTANEIKDDATIRKVIKIASNNGYGGVYMCNLFSQVTAYPKELIVTTMEPENDLLILEYAKKSSKILFAWGNFKEAKGRSEAIKKLIPVGYCLVKNKNGSPKHPLYCLDKQPIIIY